MLSETKRLQPAKPCSPRDPTAKSACKLQGTSGTSEITLHLMRLTQTMRGRSCVGFRGHAGKGSKSRIALEWPARMIQIQRPRLGPGRVRTVDSGMLEYEALWLEVQV